MIPNLFPTYPTDIAQHVIDAMTPSIEAEIKRVHEAVEAAKAEALKQALQKFNTSDVANDPPPPIDPNPPVPPKPGKRRSFWDGKTAGERNAIMSERWIVRNANKGLSGKAQKAISETQVSESKEAANPIRYGSVCSGVEGLSLAWEPLGGFEPVFFSEIEPFPSAVLAKRWPDVPNLGDFTKIDGKKWKGKLDILMATLPCQAFSLTGNRKGAQDERGAMFRPFLRLADDIDAPVVIMENVVGLRSDPAFHAIIKGLSGSGIKGRIPRDGRHDGPSRRLAWRVLGSGTEQRRPRLFLVACSQSSGLDPASLLPEPGGFATHRAEAPESARVPGEGSVVWLNADTTPKWSTASVGTLRASGGSGGRSLVCVDGRVRELMPEERERLMGWDGQHTAVEFKGTEKTLDRLRNRAIGNSLALPPVHAIGEKVRAAFQAVQHARPIQNAKLVDLRLGECLAEMATLPNASVNLIAADLPYETTACKWDRRIDLDAFWTEVRRILTPTGTVVLTSAGVFTADLIASNRDWFRYDQVWVKSRKGQFLHADYRPLSAHENILVFSPARACLRARKKMTYNPQGVTELSEPRVFEKAAVSAGVFKPITTKATKRTQTRTNYPSTILAFASEGQNQHPTQKPVALMEHLIATYSNPGDTVLDPTMGSGTTGVAASALGRKFIGIEKEAEFFNIAMSRLREKSRMAA